MRIQAFVGGKKFVFVVTPVIFRSLLIKLVLCVDYVIIDFLSAVSQRLANPTGNYMFKVNDGNTRTRCELCSKVNNKEIKT